MTENRTMVLSSSNAKIRRRVLAGLVLDQEDGSGLRDGRIGLIGHSEHSRKPTAHRTEIRRTHTDKSLA